MIFRNKKIENEVFLKFQKTFEKKVELRILKIPQKPVFPIFYWFFREKIPSVFPVSTRIFEILLVRFPARAANIKPSWQKKKIRVTESDAFSSR